MRTYRASAVRHRGLDGMAATVTDAARRAVAVETPLLGTGNLLNLLAAAAVAMEMGVPLAAIAERAATMKPAARRGELLRLPGRHHARSTTPTTRVPRR